METNTISYFTESPELTGYNQPIAARFQKAVDLNDEKVNGFITFSIEKSEMDYFIDQIKFRNHINDLKYHYCFTAIRNLIKKNEFLQLSLQLAENQITEEEFESELDDNPDKYVIKMGYLEDPSHVQVIGNVLNHIGKQFTTDEVSELFSIEINSLNNNIKALAHK